MILDVGTPNFRTLAISSCEMKSRDCSVKMVCMVNKPEASSTQNTRQTPYSDITGETYKPCLHSQSRHLDVPEALEQEDQGCTSPLDKKINK